MLFPITCQQLDGLIQNLLHDIEPISIQFTIESVSFILGGFYRPPGSPESYLLALQTSIYTLPQNSSIFICAWRFQYT